MATRRDADKSFIFALGPLKCEFIRLSSVSNDDTVDSRLANPLSAMLFPDADASGTVNCSASVSGKTVTLRDPVSAINHFLLVFGF